MAYDLWQSCVLVPGFSRSECASWVQAWGSIGAIVATAFAAAWPFRKALKNEHLKERVRARERYQTVARLFSEAMSVFDKVIGIEDGLARDPETNDVPTLAMVRFHTYRSAGNRGLEHDLFAIATYIAALQRVDVAELSDAEASSALIGGLFALKQLSEHLVQMHAAEEAGDTQAAFLFGGLREASRVAGNAALLFAERAGPSARE